MTRNRILQALSDRTGPLVRRSAAAAARLLPTPVLRRLDRRRGATASAIDPPVLTAPVRMLIAPANFAGQGFAWARAVEAADPRVQAANMDVQDSASFRFPADQAVPEPLYRASRSWQRRQWHAVTRSYTHVMIESERSVFGSYFGGDIPSEEAHLRRKGLSVAFLCHGSDIRLPSRHAALEADSPFRPGLWERTPVLERVARRNLAFLGRVDGPVFVSTPDLLIDVAHAHWLPVVVDPSVWATANAPLADPVPLVVHAPSRAIVKGSDLIDPVLQRLEHEGLIRYRRIAGVPAAEMPTVYRDADIVLDQFRIGNYGVAACEALAAGRVVISHVSDQVRGEVRSRTGRELPVIESRADELETRIRAVLADRDEARRVAAAGPEYVEGLHDGSYSGRVIVEEWIDRTHR